jgi:hypothetical protein
VYICFDSDVMLKSEVHLAMVRLGAFLGQRGAHIAYVYLPSGPGGGDVDPIVEPTQEEIDAYIMGEIEEWAAEIAGGEE